MNGSDNPMASGMTRATPENQQETERDPQRPYASHLAIKRDEEMVHALRRRRGSPGSPRINWKKLGRAKFLVG